MPLDHQLDHAILRLPRAAKRTIAVAADIALCALSLWLALCLRLEGWVPPTAEHAWAALMAVCLAIPIFFRFRLYDSIFRFSGWNAMLAVARAMALFGLAFALIVTVWGLPGVPRTVGIIQPLLMFVAVGASRLLVRVTLGDLYRGMFKRAGLPGVLIYGAGSAGRQLASALMNSRNHRLIGFIDDNAALQGRTVDFVPIFSREDLDDIVPRLHVTEVLLAIPSLGRASRREVVETLRPYPVHVRTLPGLTELASGKVGLGDLHELDVADLLGRDPVEPDMALLSRHIAGKVVLVTGAGGSIGSELCRQIVRCAPTTLLMLDASEHALYQIHRELEDLQQATSDMHPRAALVPLLGNVVDERRMGEVMRTWHPSTVYHAAAYKHVPLVEHNVLEGVRNNVWGTLVTARAALSEGVGNFVLISTDKAVRPTNVMGASKRLSEMVLQALADPQAGQTCFTMVRFGNVLGSSGSVVPLFRQQIAQGGPITLTHPEITRYFMTIPEASQLVIQAGAMANGGEVFVLDMGEPVKIIDLARRMVELSGLRVREGIGGGGDIAIDITGLRPGEKLYEELLIGADAEPTVHRRIMKAHEDFLSWAILEPTLLQLQQAIYKGHVESVLNILVQLVSGYSPSQYIAQDNILSRDGAYRATNSISPANNTENPVMPPFGAESYRKTLWQSEPATPIF